MEYFTITHQPHMNSSQRLSVAILLLPPDPVPSHNGASTSSCWQEAFHSPQGNNSTLPEIVLCLISRVQNETERTCWSQIHLKYTECGRNAGRVRAVRNEKESPKLWFVCSGEWRNGKQWRERRCCPTFWNLEMLDPWVVWSDKPTQLNLPLWPKYLG